MENYLGVPSEQCNLVTMCSEIFQLEFCLSRRCCNVSLSDQFEIPKLRVAGVVIQLIMDKQITESENLLTVQVEPEGKYDTISISKSLCSS